MSRHRSPDQPDKPRRVCAYCGEERKLTRDHVPPKVLLAEPFPPNLITVPACDDCNQGFKADDEYTAVVAAMDLRAQNHPSGRTRWQSLARGLNKPGSEAFRAAIARQQETGRILGPNGLPLGGRIKSDKARMDATGRHIVRGLYYALTKTPLHVTMELIIGCQTGVDERHEAMQTFQRGWEKWPDRRQSDVGEGFRYSTVAIGGQSMWFIELYDYLCWFGVVWPKGTTLVDDGTANAEPA